jgi:hypothetical protein
MPKSPSDKSNNGKHLASSSKTHVAASKKVRDAMDRTEKRFSKALDRLAKK